MENLELDNLLQRIKVIHKKKATDYSASGPDENFERVAYIQRWFHEDIDKSFVGFIAVKLARLSVLLGKRLPNNESIDDSFLDLCTYTLLWAANYTRRSQKDAVNEKPAAIAEKEWTKNQAVDAAIFTNEMTYKQKRKTDIAAIMLSLNEKQLDNLLAQARIIYNS